MTKRRGVKNLPERIFKIDAGGDTVYTKAISVSDARRKLYQIMGVIPVELLTFTEIENLPDGEEFLAGS